MKFSDGAAVTARRRGRLDPPLGGARRRRPAHDAARQGHRRRRTTRPSRSCSRSPTASSLDLMARSTTPLLFIMRKKEAETDPNQQVTTNIGSGPFTFNQDETKPGQRYVYDRNPNYVPRRSRRAAWPAARSSRSTASSTRTWRTQQTARRGAEGRRDRLLRDPADRPARPARGRQEHQARGPEQERQCRHDAGSTACTRRSTTSMRARRCSTSIKQEEYPQGGVRQSEILPEVRLELRLRHADGERREHAVVQGGAEPRAKAKELFQKAGYDGRPVVVLHATNIDFMNNAALIIAQRLRETGVNVELATSDWGGVVTRRAVKTPPDQGGWNIFITWAGGASVGNPIALRRPQPRTARRAGSAGRRTSCTRSCATNGPPPRRRRSRRRSRARSRRTPGTSCRMSGSASGSRPSPTGRTSRASSRSRRSSRSGISRRPERRSSNRKHPARAGRFLGARPRYCTKRGPPSAGFSFSPRMPRRRATSE